MALPSAEVIKDLELLITSVTGFKKGTENFSSCKKYALSHFVHHSYPSVNKTTVQTRIEDLQKRLYTQGKLSLCRELRRQVDIFLGYEDVFKSNAQCEIQWILLNLISSLSSNLSDIYELPELLPLTDDDLIPEDFDWGSYLKNGLPTCHVLNDRDSDSFSSLSSESGLSGDPIEVDETESLENNISLINKCDYGKLSPPASRSSSKYVPYITSPNILTNRENLLNNDQQNYQRLATERSDLTGNEKFISSKEIIDDIVNSLLTGNDFTCYNAAVYFADKDNLNGFLETLSPYVAEVRKLREFINNGNSSRPKTIRAYASCLKKSLLPYEIMLDDISYNDFRLEELKEQLEPFLSFVRSLAILHRRCFIDDHSEPNWRSVLRVLTGLHEGMIFASTPRVQVFAFATFFSCFLVYADFLDALLSSPSDVDPFQEFIIVKNINTTEYASVCTYTAQPYGPFMNELRTQHVPLFDCIVNKITDASDSLGLICLVNRFADISTSTSVCNIIIRAIKEEITVVKSEVFNDEDESTVFEDMLTLVQGSDSSKPTMSKWFNFLAFARWEINPKLNSFFKCLEHIIEAAVDSKIEAVRCLAKKILVDENSLTRHLTLLRNVLLCNDASLLLPFTKFLFSLDLKWGHPYLLSQKLGECVAIDFPELVEHISAEVKYTDHQQRDILQIINSISIHYQVDFPISLIITEYAMEMYNDIFRVLLTLKWAQFTLTRLPFPETTVKKPKPIACVLHRLFLLRFACLTDFSIVNNYFMAQVVSGNYINFDDYKDIQLLIADQRNLLNRIYSSCKKAYIEWCSAVLSEILRVCLYLRSNWSRPEYIRIVTLKEMEALQKKTHNRISSLFSA